MAIDNESLLSFVNESVRPSCDRLAGLLPLVGQILDAVRGRGYAAVLGTDDETLFRAEPWEVADYMAVEPHAVTGSDSGGRTLLTNHDVIAFLRVLVTLGLMAESFEFFADQNPGTTLPDPVTEFLSTRPGDY